MSWLGRPSFSGTFTTSKIETVGYVEDFYAPYKELWKGIGHLDIGGFPVTMNHKTRYIVYAVPGSVVSVHENEADALSAAKRHAANNDVDVYVARTFKKLAQVPKDVQETDVK